MKSSDPKAMIVRAAAMLFAEFSYHGTSMAQIESAVSLKRGALYHHIGNKEALLYEISRSQVDTLLEYGKHVRESSLGPEEQLRAIAAGLLQNILEHRAEWTVFYRDFHALTEGRLQEVIRRRHAFESLVEEIIGDGVREGTFVPFDPIVTKGFLGALNLSYTWLTPDGRLGPSEVADLFCDLMVNGMRQRPAVVPTSQTS